MTSSALSKLREEIRGLPADCDERKFAAIILIITDVENVTLIHLSDDERHALARELYNLHESIESLQIRTEKVKRAEHYGRIGFNLWLTAKDVYTGEEIERELNHRQEMRRQTYLNINKAIENEEEQLAKEGLTSVTAIYLRRKEETLNKIREGFEKRCRKAKAFIHSCNESAKNEILELALDKGLLVKDDYWRQTLPFLAPLMLDEVEKIMKRR